MDFAEKVNPHNRQTLLEISQRDWTRVQEEAKKLKGRGGAGAIMEMLGIDPLEMAMEQGDLLQKIACIDLEHPAELRGAILALGALRIMGQRQIPDHGFLDILASFELVLSKAYAETLA